MIIKRSKEAAVILFALAVSFGCNRRNGEQRTTESARLTEQKSAITSPADKATDESATQPAAASGDQPVVTLLDAGSAPRRLLRMQMKPGQKSTLRISTGVEIQGGNGVPKAVPPTTVMVLEIKVSKIDDDGNVHYEFGMVSTDCLGGGLDDFLCSRLKELQGLPGSAIMTGRGFNVANTINMSPVGDAKAKLLSSTQERIAQQLATPLPEEEVGVGGKWKVETRLLQKKRLRIGQMSCKKCGRPSSCPFLLQLICPIRYAPMCSICSIWASTPAMSTRRQFARVPTF